MKTKYLLFAIALTFLVTLTHTSCSSADDVIVNEEKDEDLDKGDSGGNTSTGGGPRSVKVYPENASSTENINLENKTTSDENLQPK